MQVNNQIQTLTPEQQARCYFAVVATDQMMADGTRQNSQKAMVRLRNGAYAYVRELPQISKDDPQPNGDYSIAIDNNHSDDVADQSGVGWLFIGNDGLLHMMYCLSTNAAANAVQPLAADNMLQFSTEGFVKDMANDGTYGDFWISAVAPVKLGNDPGTQSVENQLKGAVMAEDDKKTATGLTEDDVAKKVNEVVAKLLKKNGKTAPSDVMKAAGDLFDELGITDTKWMADITSSLLAASGGAAYDGQIAGGKSAAPADPASAPTSGGDDVNPQASANTVVEKPEGKKNNVKTMSAGTFKPQVSQVAQVVANDFDKKKNSPEYLEAWGRAVIHGGLNNPHANMFDANQLNPSLAGWFKKNDIDVTFDPDNVSLTPELVVDEITELLQSDNSLLPKINMMNGVKQYSIPGYVADTTYAQGRARGASGTKPTQKAKIATRTILAQSLYKFVSLPADFVDDNGGLGAAPIIKWVTRELPAKVVRAAEEALICGGVLNDNADGDTSATPFGSVYSIQSDIEAKDSPYGSVYKPAAGESLIQSLSNAVTEVELLDSNPTGTGIYLIISRKNFRKILDGVNLGNGTQQTTLNTNATTIAGYLGIDGVLQLPWLRDSTLEPHQNPNVADFQSKYQALLVNLSAVRGVGELTPTSLSQYYLRANMHDFEAKLRFGAGLSAPKMAVGIAQPTAPKA